MPPTWRFAGGRFYGSREPWRLGKHGGWRFQGRTATTLFKDY